MKLTLKALTVMLTMAFIVVLAGDVMAQRGRGGEGRGLGPGGGVPGSAECINACPYLGSGKGYGMGYGRAAGISRQNFDSGQKSFGYGRGMNGRGFSRGPSRR